VGSTHAHGVFTRSEVLLDLAPSVNEYLTSLTIDFQSALEMRRHQLHNRVQLAQAAIRSNNRSLSHSMALCAAQENNPESSATKHKQIKSTFETRERVEGDVAHKWLKT